MKPLDLDMSIYDATKKYPELIEIIAGMGFPQIRNKFLRSTVGKRYTLRQAIEKLGIGMDKVESILAQHGFYIATPSGR